MTAQILYRCLITCMIVGNTFGFGGLLAGLCNLTIGFTYSILGFALTIVIMPFYFIYRTRYFKARLAFKMKQKYHKNVQSPTFSD